VTYDGRTFYVNAQDGSPSTDGTAIISVRDAGALPAFG
jgi:hypothetical protein